MRPYLLLGLVLSLIVAGASFAGAARAQMGPCGAVPCGVAIPVGQLPDDMAAMQGALDAQAGAAAQAESERILAANPLGVFPVSAFAPTAGADAMRIVARNPELATFTFINGGDQRLAQVGGAGVGAGMIGNLHIVVKPIKKRGDVVGTTVLFTPFNLKIYAAVIRMNRYDARGIPHNIGLPVKAESDTVPARPSAWQVGASCNPARRAPRGFYVSVTAAAVMMGSGVGESGTMYAKTYWFNC